jgi:hypothetical protein
MEYLRDIVLARACVNLSVFSIGKKARGLSGIFKCVKSWRKTYIPLPLFLAPKKVSTDFQG